MQIFTRTTMTATIAATIAAATASISIIAFQSSLPRRRRPRETLYTVRGNDWDTVRNDPDFDGWFRENMRCTQFAFKKIVERIEERWLLVNKELDRARTVFDIETRVGVTLHFLTHEGSYRQSAQVFGTSKTQAYNYVKQGF